MQLLADAAAGIEGGNASEPPAGRGVPECNVFALGDQIAVTARDLATAAAGLDGALPVWWQGARYQLADVLDVVAAAAQGLRAAL